MPAIKKPNQHFDATTYAGNGGTQAITNSGSMQPDLVWIKGRNQAYYHCLQDVIRGASATLFSNVVNVEETNQARLSSFNSNGFTLTSKNDANNGGGDTYVAWQWKAGGTAVTNTSGTITSQVSANPTAGFSIVTWTGTGTNRPSIGHGLGVAPAMIIEKGRDAGSGPFNWVVQHKSLSSWNNSLFLSANNPENSGSGGGTAPSSTVYYAAANNYAGENNVRYVAYCFAEVAGYSAFGSYTGNGSTNGPFIYTGFRPKLLMIKRTEGGTNDWAIIDTTREPNNMGITGLKPNASEAEYSGYNYRDILSNGFKLRNGDSDTNNNGSTYIYAAFAEAPFKFSNAR
jgi:hypothetical protein